MKRVSEDWWDDEMLGESRRLPERWSALDSVMIPFPSQVVVLHKQQVSCRRLAECVKIEEKIQIRGSNCEAALRPIVTVDAPKLSPKPLTPFVFENSVSISRLYFGRASVPELWSCKEKANKRSRSADVLFSNRSPKRKLNQESTKGNHGGGGGSHSRAERKPRKTPSEAAAEAPAN